MIKISLNDELYELNETTNLLNFLNEQGITLSATAVLINQQFIARSSYENTILQEGDVVLLVSPMQGG